MDWFFTSQLIQGIVNALAVMMLYYLPAILGILASLTALGYGLVLLSSWLANYNWEQDFRRRKKYYQLLNNDRRI